MANDGAVAFDEEQDENKGEFDFQVTFEPVDDLSMRTACFCCVCALDDCKDFMTAKAQRNCCCLQDAFECQCFQCTDPEKHALACCQGAGQCKQCSMIPLAKPLTDENGNEVDYYGCMANGGKFASLCCLTGKTNGSCCDPIGMPDTCVKAMAQLLCIHLRCAIPCEDETGDVPCECFCLGMEIYKPSKE